MAIGTLAAGVERATRSHRPQFYAATRMTGAR